MSGVEPLDPRERVFLRELLRRSAEDARRSIRETHSDSTAYVQGDRDPVETSRLSDSVRAKLAPLLSEGVGHG